MYRFFVEESQINGNKVTIEGKDAHHIKDVLRLRISEEIYVCTGDEWEYTCEIQSFSTSEVYASVIDAAKPGKELPSKITLYQCLPKKDKMELIIQKAVELGAFSVVPVASSRCIVNIDKKKEASKIERWNAISQSAAKQSKRMIVPEVTNILSFKDAINEGKEADICLIPYEKSEGMDLTRELLMGIKPGMSVSIIIGPEGGFSEEEVAIAVENGFKAISLGRRILRTETAGMSVLSILGFLLDDKGI